MRLQQDDFIPGHTYHTSRRRRKSVKLLYIRSEDKLNVFEPISNRHTFRTNQNGHVRFPLWRGLYYDDHYKYGK
jgi:hypothetical protein